MGNYIYSDEEVIDWANEYEKTHSIHKVAEKFNVSNSNVWIRLKKININFIGSSKYSFDQDFFAQNTQESFYWAGFIAADGCVFVDKKGNKSLRIGLSIVDKNHLNKFKNIIKYTGKVYERKRSAMDQENNVCYIAIGNSKIFDDLARFNIVPRKTHIYTFPEWLINHSLVNHFIRGYFDGDGSFWVSKKTNKRKKCSFNMCGTKNFLNICEDILVEKCNLNKVKIQKTKNIFSLGYCGNNNTIKFRDFIYKNAVIFLERKKDIVYNDWIDIKPKSHRSKNIIGICNTQVVYFNSITDAAKKGGFERTCIMDCLKGRQKQHKGYIWQYVK